MRCCLVPRCGGKLAFSGKFIVVNVRRFFFFHFPWRWVAVWVRFVVWRAAVVSLRRGGAQVYFGAAVSGARKALLDTKLVTRLLCVL